MSARIGSRIKSRIGSRILRTSSAVLFAFALTVTSAAVVKAEDGIIKVKSAYSVAETIARLKKDIADTDDDALYQNQRERTSGYRFDNLPAGTYVVDMAFAELRNGLGAGDRVFDVSINGTLVLPGYDAAAAVGTLTADHRAFNVTVAAGGSIIVSLGDRPGKLPPMINAVRVTHRPDL